MDTNQKVDTGMIVGIDISPYYVQVSCHTEFQGEAQTISTRMGEEIYEIPLCLFKRLDADSWQYGDKARENMSSNEGVYIEDIWSGVLCHRELVLEDETYSYERLMHIFLERVLGLLSKSGYSRPLQALVITADRMDDGAIRHLIQITQGLPVAGKQIYFIDYKESFAAYAVRGNKELWKHEVFLFYYMNRGLKAYGLRVNQRRLPFQIQMGEMDYGEIEYSREELEASDEAREDMDSRFYATVSELFDKKIISSVYLIGEGFEPGWMKESLRLLCRGRRVFQGNNLFTKGACYAGEWYLGVRKPAGEYTSSQMVGFDVRLPLLNQEREEEFLHAVRRGELWYHAGFDIECMLDVLPEKGSCPSIGIWIHRYVGENSHKAEDTEETLVLSGFPDRPQKASRIRIGVDCVDVHTVRIQVEDLGFGEFYPASGRNWEKLLVTEEAAV